MLYLQRCSFAPGDFIVDDDGMGYADIGEEEDWGRTDEKAPRDADAHATSKKRKDGSATGTHCMIPRKPHFVLSTVLTHKRKKAIV